VTHLVLAGVMETPADLDRVLAALPPATVTVVRLTAPADLRASRLRDRMRPSAALDWHLARTVELDKILDRSSIETIEVDNGDRAPRDVAVEVLDRARWRAAP
jgi:adenylylsulfate kinase